MISDGAFSIFTRFSAREKTFHEMPVEENDNFLRAWEGKRFFWIAMYTFYIQNRFEEGSRVQLVQRSSIVQCVQGSSNVQCP